MVVTAPSLGVLVAHSAGPVLRSQEGSGEEGLLRYARGIVVIAFNARSGPVPLLLGYFGARRDRPYARMKVRRSECPNGAPHV